MLVSRRTSSLRSFPLPLSPSSQPSLSSSSPLPLPTPPNWRSFSSTRPRTADFTHAVIGGGVVGLAVARRLQMREGVSTVLIERHGMVGMETSSRNSEVIHAGLYYGTDTLKKDLCIRGKHMLYDLCTQHSIPYRNTGKWIVAQNEQQLDALSKMHSLSKQIDVPTHFLSKQEAASREPDVRAEAGVLESSSTGIVDSHSLMQFLEGDFENLGGICAFNSHVTRVSALSSGNQGWEITTTTPDDNNETTSITAETLINTAGLAAIPLSNSILPPHRRRSPHYAKGTYFSYSLSQPRPSTLIYPAPVTGLGGLGTHLTLDLNGAIRFGPDVEWIDDSRVASVGRDDRDNSNNVVDDDDANHHHTTSPDFSPYYAPNAAKLAAALDEIRAYLPSVDASAVHADYVGIRPKLGPEGSGSHDFYIEREEGFEGFVNLLGIESPGLTSALAIAERVEALLYR